MAVKTSSSEGLTSAQEQSPTALSSASSDAVQFNEDEYQHKEQQPSTFLCCFYCCTAMSESTAERSSLITDQPQPRYQGTSTELNHSAREDDAAAPTDPVEENDYICANYTCCQKGSVLNKCLFLALSPFIFSCSEKDKVREAIAWAFPRAK
ncbi:MAG: hypothetical protein ACPGUD_09595 [Parashewanella sp.]